MTKDNSRKKELDRQRTEWRKKHRTLNGRIILYPEKTPEHINARGSKVYNWFWKKVLLETNPQEIPAIISAVKGQIKREHDKKKDTSISNYDWNGRRCLSAEAIGRYQGL